LLHARVEIITQSD